MIQDHSGPTDRLACILKGKNVDVFFLDWTTAELAFWESVGPMTVDALFCRRCREGRIAEGALCSVCLDETSEPEQ